MEIDDPAALRTDFDALINCVQWHKGHPERYCKKRVRLADTDPSGERQRALSTPRCGPSRL